MSTGNTTLVQKNAPNFKAEAVVGGDFTTVSLDDYKGKWVVLYFYPLDFTFVCPTEILDFDKHLEDFQKRNAVVIGCSTDSKYSHLAWLNTPRKEGGIEGVRHPLIGDFTKEVSSSYGVLTEDGVALRAVFIIDDQGVVRFQMVNDLNIGRNVKEVLRVLDALQYSAEHGEVCPAEWEPGQDTIKPDPKEAKEYFSKHA